MLQQFSLSFARTLRKLLAQLYPRANFDGVSFPLVIPPQPDMGDFALPCFAIAQRLKEPPKQIAATLAEALHPTSLIASYSSMGPYLNISVKRASYIARVVSAITRRGAAYGTHRANRRKRVMVEFSSPNTNKPQHLGHVRNNVYGAAIANLLAASGIHVVRANLINDRGIHIMKSVLAYQRWGKSETPKRAGVKGDCFVGEWYVRFEREAKKNPELLEEAQALLRLWETGDDTTRRVWKRMNAWVLEGFRTTYSRLGIAFDKIYFESELYEQGKRIVLQALAAGICYKRPDGAIEIDLSGEGLDKKVLLRADGTSIYITQDLGATVKKFEEYKLDEAYWVVASEQNYHFHVLFALLKKLGYPFWDQCHHIAYDLVHLPEGRMKSREGTSVDADDLLDRLETLARETVIAKHPRIAKREATKRARIIALGALKFMLVRVAANKTITFNPKSALSFEGATGPYIQYTYARAKSILRKGLTVKKAVHQKKRATGTVEHEEMALATALAAYPDVVARAGEETAPAILATYLLDVASAFNTFYHALPVLRAKETSLRKARLALTQATATVLCNGLALLGISAPEKM
ncbi:MAG: arginine--tRNA ligase [Parcubacteria group bacterium CG08_land_8_20_14_0_20_48_21]|nr:MAG: arginine--tRNA ligase [Parcubacteria group bacterium CG2_30_48_51]PIS32517.1 MAG: arginine--tRNA ligase [Parcubacteria group bacterium CG08_land_8_20_14_0_20_48_21]PIW79524.1 MAG: arginine--tRNA ligase [Parcubacteria group bacterium CG_4_8_14_3_um_filter_48_16]PIY78102.1 MAG: arginine--tRNA ligase [Parcubacteria group bacterium CG_4_10_14_0_8_um_filter_48_154]PIZ77669.1 MAG: arginine--tRNA ligase [bacterium CG_4_10_14_0_2_um_filter_48_144]PJC39878.1 MAG: arginine--tRNA ligase [Parcubac